MAAVGALASVRTAIGTWRVVDGTQNKGGGYQLPQEPEEALGSGRNGPIAAGFHPMNLRRRPLFRFVYQDLNILHGAGQ